MDPAALAAAVAEDRRAGWRPFCVAATVGTTSTTSVDPVPAIADVCARERLRLHVGGVSGGLAALGAQDRRGRGGCPPGGSVGVHPHQLPFTPLGRHGF